MFLDNLFQESTRDPTQLLVIGWGKMDQSKTILPRARALANTPFHKKGRSLCHITDLRVVARDVRQEAAA